MISNYFWNKKQIVTYVLSVLVLCIHCSSFSNYSNTEGILDLFSKLMQCTVSSIAVPLFFIISGALFFRNYSRTVQCYKEKLSKRLKTLVIPYLLWNIINMLFNIFATKFFSKYFIGRKPFEFSIENIALGIFHYKYNTVFWFVFALIAFVVFSPLLDCLLHSKITGMLSIAVLTVLRIWDIGLPHPLFFSKTCIIYYLVGGLIGKFYFDKFSEKSSLKQQIASIFILIFEVVYYMLVRYKYINNNAVFDTALLILSSLAFWSLFDLLLSGKTSAPNYTKHSFWVFATHLNVSAVITKLLYLIMPKANYFSVINFVLTVVLTLLAVEIICFIIKKISPKLYALLSGSR